MDFAEWVLQGGGYLIFFGAICSAIGAITVIASKGEKWIHNPAREAAAKSEEVDRRLNERVDGLEAKRAECDERFANDFSSINQLRRELERLVEIVIANYEANQLIMQHIVTGNHNEEIKAYMREHARIAIKHEWKD